ncbi:MAG: hypothetical protein EXR70_07430 [Deltaproteobacteria bacterium]|nr:hypothetical protein [Deltaproteobacteria bacterium]
MGSVGIGPEFNRRTQPILRGSFYLLAAGCFLENLRYYAELWLNQLIVTAFIAEKIWEKHRVRRYEVEEVLAHRQAIRLRHKQDPVRVVVIGRTQARRLLKIVLQFQGRGRYFLVTAMDLTGKERTRYEKKNAGHS